MRFEEKYNKAISLIQQNVRDDANKNKPLIPHLLRVGEYLHRNGYSDTIVNAGILHDVLEWTSNSKETVLNEFGQEVLDIVLANTKNRQIEDTEQRREDYVARCAKIGIDALIVKAADVLDSYKYYAETQHEKELERSRNIAALILEHVSVAEDPIFEQLETILKT